MNKLITQKQFDETHVVSVVEGNILDEQTEAIINAANENLTHGGGIAKQIADAAGPSMYEECKKIKRVATGSAALTSAGDLKFKAVIHAVGPIFGHYDPEDADDLLCSAIQAALKLAEEAEIKSLSIPAVSSGLFGFPVARCTSVIVDAISDHLFWYPETCLTDIRLVAMGSQCVIEFKRALEAVKFTDDE
ncbi:MAG: macro domain-containing protein [Armatimonadota bacterium]